MDSKYLQVISLSMFGISIVLFIPYLIMSILAWRRNVFCSDVAPVCDPLTNGLFFILIISIIAQIILSHHAKKRMCEERKTIKLVLILTVVLFVLWIISLFGGVIFV